MDHNLELIIARLEILEIEVCNILYNPGNPPAPACQGPPGWEEIVSITYHLFLSIFQL